MGAAVESRRRLQEASALIGPDGTPATLAEIHRTLAMIAIDAGELETARDAIDRADALARKSGDLRLEARVLAVRVMWHYRRDEFEEALDPAQRLLEIGREQEMVDIEASGLDLVAELHLRLGRLERAAELADEAVALARQIGDVRALQWALLTSVEIALANEDAGGMAAIVAEAEECFDRIELSRLDPERIALLRAQELFALWSGYSQDLVALSLASAAPGSDAARRVVEEGFRRAGLWKGRALLQGIAEHRHGVRNADVIQLRRELRDVLAERENLAVRIAAALRTGEGDVGPMRGRVDELAERAEELRANMRAVAPADASLDVPEGIAPDELAAVLATGDVLVEFVEGKRRLYAYRLRAKELSFHDLGERAVLEPDGSGGRARTRRPPGPPGRPPSRPSPRRAPSGGRRPR